MEMAEVEERTVADDMVEDLNVCRECTGTWKVACYGAWSPNSQFWEDFLEDGWEDGAYTPRACCLRIMCGLLFWFFAPLWCCKAIFFFLFWPCICCCRAAKEGNCNRDYFRVRRGSKHGRNSLPLAYIESAQPSRPNEILYQFSAPRGVPPESPIPEIRIQTELENGTYVTSPVEDSDVALPPPIGHRLPTITISSDQIQPLSTGNGHPLHSLPATNGHPMPSSNGHPLTFSNGRALRNPQPQSSTASTRSHHNTNSQQSPAGTTQKSSDSGRIREGIEDDPPPPYPMSESPGGAAKTRSRQQNSTSYTQHTSTNHSQSHHASPPPRQPPATATGTGAHSVAGKTTSSKAKGMDNNLYRAVVLEGFQGITGKVTTV
jgi:hypothetical protein